jgi:ribonucleoside-diphosphate reductase beta chain
MFYAGFIWFWYLGSKMKGSAQMISFIARDERTHVLLFRQIMTSTIKAYPKIDKKELEQIAAEMVKESVEMEINWLHHITKGEIAEFNETTVSR